MNGKEESRRTKLDNHDDDDGDGIMMIVYTKMSFCFYANRSRWHRSVNDFMIRKARLSQRRQHIEITKYKIKSCLD